MNTYKKIILACFLCIFIIPPLKSQVTIAPTNLFIENNDSFGSYMVINSSDTPQEIIVDFFFGYTMTDENGNQKLIENDSLKAQNHSISQYIRAFPQNFILPPGQRQIVRLRLSPPSNISDGTYWARIKTSSEPEAPPIELSTEEIVAAQIGITIEQVTGLYYKKGLVNTSIEVNEMRIIPNNETSITALADYKRLGNSPFLGTITFKLSDQSGNILSESSSSTTLFFDGTHKQNLILDDVDKGEYNLSVTFETKRSDISNSDLVQMQPVTSTTTVTIP